MEEIKEIEETFESEKKKSPPMPVSHPQYGGVAIWTYSLIMRATKAKQAIEGLYFIQDHPLAKEAIEKHRKLHQHLDASIADRKYQEWQAKMGNMTTSEEIDLALQNTILARQGERAARLAEKGIELQSEKAIQLLKKGKPELLESNFDTQLLKVLIEV